jgi:hypothetical protein
MKRHDGAAIYVHAACRPKQLEQQRHVLGETTLEESP